MVPLLHNLWVLTQAKLLRAVGKLLALLLRLWGMPQPDLTRNIRLHPDAPPLRCAFYLPAGYYNPLGASFPAYLNLHGGAFIAGGPTDDGEFCKHIARTCRCVVVSLGYSLAPEKKFPAAVHEAAAAVGWLTGHNCPLRIDPGRIALGGFSAGANIAAAAAQEVRGKLTALVNLYSVSDLSRPADDWLGCLARESYIPKGWDLKDPLLSPVYANPKTLPDLLVSIIAGIDPAREDNLALAQRIESDKSKRSVWRLYEGIHHGWTHVPKGAPLADEEKKWEAYNLVAAELNRAWGGCQ